MTEALVPQVSEPVKAYLSQIGEHEADGFAETEFYLPETYATQGSATQAAIQVGRRKVNVGFERGSAVVKG